jgi:flagellar motility protein MotE (MotC chaperone)
VKPTPLTIIAVIFACSFAGRMISVADASLNTLKDPLASEKEDAVPASLSAEETKLASIADSPTTAAKSKRDEISAAKNPSQKSQLLASIKERSDMLDKREIALEDRIRFLETIEKRVDQKLLELKKSNDALSELVVYANEASQNDIDLLSKMYEQMKPAKAGEIFNKMDPVFAAGFLTQMNSENAALILTNMNTDKAYETSMIIASRNAAVHQR